MSHAFRSTEIFNRERLANWIQDYIKGAKLGRHGLGKAEQEGLLGDEIIQYPDCGEGHGPKVCLNLWTWKTEKKSILMYLNF